MIVGSQIQTTFFKFVFLCYPSLHNLQLRQFFETFKERLSSISEDARQLV